MRSSYYSWGKENSEITNENQDGSSVSSKVDAEELKRASLFFEDSSDPTNIDHLL
jgi:hypothetical protein